MRDHFIFIGAGAIIATVVAGLNLFSIPEGLDFREIIIGTLGWWLAAFGSTLALVYSLLLAQISFTWVSRYMPKYIAGPAGIALFLVYATVSLSCVFALVDAVQPAWP